MALNGYYFKYESFEVEIPNANQAGIRNVARTAALLSSLPETVPATTLNRLCGSGLDAVGYVPRPCCQSFPASAANIGPPLWEGKP
jgi:Thiolase, N-terminal domain